APVAERLLGPRVDEIEGDARKRLLGDADGGARLPNRVLAAERAQLPIVEGLYAERDPVDAGRAVAAKARPFHARGVGFQGDLRMGQKAPVFRDRVEENADG